ncbi:hypothetical protein MSG28_010864, partial [Choristoneura fumiferana]
RGICVATIPPIRPIDEQSACIEFLVYVGNSSEVKTGVDIKEAENTTQAFIYPLYWYQALSMHFHMLCNVNIDTFILGVLILAISQLDILDGKLRRVTEKELNTGERKVVGEVPTVVAVAYDEAMMKLKQSIVHFDELGKFTLPAPWQYFIFLATYMFIMIIQILSQLLSSAVYNCNWTAKSRYFKSSLRLFAERANKPLSITAGKMFPLSLTTFTSIINTAYSFFTLLRYMQSRQG